MSPSSTTNHIICLDRSFLSIIFSHIKFLGEYHNKRGTKVILLISPVLLRVPYSGAEVLKMLPVFRSYFQLKLH